MITLPDFLSVVSFLAPSIVIMLFTSGALVAKKTTRALLDQRHELERQRDALQMNSLNISAVRQEMAKQKAEAFVPFDKDLADIGVIEPYIAVEMSSVLGKRVAVLRWRKTL